MASPSIDDNQNGDERVDTTSLQLSVGLTTATLGETANSARSPNVLEGDTGAAIYVVAVILIYSLSIVLLIASVIRRNRVKKTVDRQIDRYLQEFQVVRETSSRDSYRGLKREIIEKLSSRDIHNTQKGIVNVVLPCSAIAIPPVSWIDKSSTPKNSAVSPSTTVSDMTSSCLSSTPASSPVRLSSTDQNALKLEMTTYCGRRSSQTGTTGGATQRQINASRDNSLSPKSCGLVKVRGTSSFNTDGDMSIVDQSVNYCDTDATLRIELTELDGWRRKVTIV